MTFVTLLSNLYLGRHQLFPSSQGIFLLFPPSSDNKTPLSCGSGGAANHGAWPQWLVQTWACDLYPANQILPPRLFCIWSYQRKALFFLVLELKEYMSLELPETAALASQSHPAWKKPTYIESLRKKKDMTVFKLVVSITPKASSHPDCPDMIIWSIKLSSLAEAKFLFVLFSSPSPIIYYNLVPSSHSTHFTLHMLLWMISTRLMLLNLELGADDSQVSITRSDLSLVFRT